MRPDPNHPNPSNAGVFHAYFLKPTNGVWTIWPAHRPGGILTARKVEFVNVHGVSQSDGSLVLQGTLKVNGVNWLGQSNASVDYARFQPPDQVVKAPVMTGKSGVLREVT